MQHHSARTGTTTLTNVRRRLLGGVLALSMATLSLAGVALSSSPAQADTAPPDPSLPTTVSTDPLPTAQIDGVVWTQLVVGNTVYVGGKFSTARPAGAAAGTQTVTRSNLLAYSLTTGALTSFAPNPNGEVRALAASPDGSRLYVGGAFTSIAGGSRNRIAAFNLATGAVDTGFLATTDSSVLGLAATSSTVYLAGSFSQVRGVARAGAAAVTAAKGDVLTWAPVKGAGTARQVIVSPDGTKVIIGGSFVTMNGSGNPGYGLAAVDAVNGTTNLALPLNNTVRNAQSDAAILTLVATADGFYGSGYVFNKSQGNLEGAFRSDWNGNLVWLEDCHGDSYSVFPTSDAVYVAGHPHYCGNVGGMPQTDPTASWTFQRGIAFSQTTATQPITKDPYGYFNFEGKPHPTLLNWFPDFNTGSFTGQSQGPWSISGNSDYVVYGGEFTTVNGKAQQGLVRFARSSIAPDTDGPRVTGSKFVPSVKNFAQGVRVSWPANNDRDNEELTYTLLRNGTAVGTPIKKRSTFWQRPMISYLDTTVTPGTSYGYRVRVTDPFGNTVTGDGATITASGGTSLNPYDQGVLNDSPQSYWPLDETSGSTVTDLAGNDDGTRQAAVTTGVAGAITGGGPANRFGGTSSSYASSGTASTALTVHSVEAWFKTTSTSGGKIVGFGNAATGNSTTLDRQLYLNNSGKVYFGVERSGAKTVNSTNAYNNGQWHHAVGTADVDGLRLYVDGQLVGSRPDSVSNFNATGYWRIGGDSPSGWGGAPSSGYLNGDIDQVAVYREVLPLAKVQAHYGLRDSGTAANVAPTASFTSTTTDLKASVNAAGSTDSDGTIAGYAWDFGDGGTDTGATASHTYDTAGTYPVKLTVTDDDGATGTVTKNVTVATTPVDTAFVSDDFNRTVAGGLGAADKGGSWTVSGGTSDFSVADGAGRFALPATSATRTAYLGSTLRDSADTTLTFSSDKLAAGGPTYLSVLGRRVSSTADYRTDVKLNTNNTVGVNLAALKGSSSAGSLTTSVTVPGTVTEGGEIHVRMQTFGTGTGTTTIRAKVWVGSASEPSTWTASTTDTYAGLQQAGSVGFRTNLSSTATNAPRTISLLDIAARPVQ